MARNIAGYISNLGKSVAYSAVDKVKTMSPTTAEFATTNAELFKTMYANIRDYKGTYTRGLQTIKKSKVYEAADLGMKSIFEDIKTGKFYNKEREDKIASKIMGFGGDSDGGFGSFDMNDDFDMNFDDNDDDFGSFDGVTSGDKVVAASIIDSSRSNAEMISMSVAKSAQHITETQKASTHLLYTQNLQAYNIMNSNLTTMNSNISNILKFSTSTLQTQAQNATKYYEETTKLMQDQTALLRQILEAVSPSKAQQKEQKKRATFGDIVGANGTPNLKEYGNIIKKNISDQLGAIGAMNSMFGEDSNALLSLVSSPLKFIPNMIVNKMVPKAVEKAFGEFDKSLSGFFGSLISKFNTMAKDEDNIFTSTIGKIFGIRNSVKSSIDTSNYNKGKVDWDGKSRKALIEVIPTQLAKIVSLLSGKPEKVYDYDKGAFVDSTEIKNMVKNMRKANSKRATSDMRDTFDKYMQNLTFSSLDEKESLEGDIEKFFEYMYSSGELFNMFGKNSKDDYLKYGIGPKSYAVIKAMFKNADKHLQHSINKDILEYRDKENKEMMDLESKADSLMQYVFNNSNLGEFSGKDKKGISSIKGGLLGALDNKGKNVFFYLQNIYKELTFIRRYGGGIGSGQGRTIMTDFDSYTSYNGGHTLDDIIIKDTSEKSEATKNREERERKRAAFERAEKKRKEKNKSLIDISNIDDERELENILTSSIKMNRFKDDLKEKDEKKKTLLDKLLEAENISGKAEVVIDNLNRITKKPMDFIVNTLNKVDQRMYEVIYGKENGNGDVKGFIDVLVLQLKSTFGKFNLWLDEKVLTPLKEKMDIQNFSDIGKKFLGAFGIDVDEIKRSIKENLFGKDSIISNIKDSIKGTFKNAFGLVKQSMKDAYGPLFNKAKGYLNPKTTKFKDLDDVAQDFEGANEIDWKNADDSVKLQEWYRQQSLNSSINSDNSLRRSNDFYKGFDFSIGNESKEKKLKYINANIKYLEKLKNPSVEEKQELQKLIYLKNRMITLDKYKQSRNFGKISVNEDYFNKPRKSSSELYEMFPNLVNSPEIGARVGEYEQKASNKLFESVFNKVSEGIDYLKSMKDSLIEIVKSIKPTNTKGFKKPSVFDSINAPFSANPLIREEEQAMYTFAQNLGSMLSNNIFSFMRGNVPKYASGGYIEQAQVATIGRGEVVLSKEDTENLVSILSNLMDNVSKQEKSKLASNMYNNSALRELDKKLGGIKIEDYVYGNEDLYKKYASMSQSDKGTFTGVSARVLSQLQEDRNTVLDKDGLPVDPVKRAAFEEAKPYIQKVGDEFVKGTRVVRNALFGEGAAEGEKKSFGLFMDDITTNISKYAPEAIGSGLLGAGVSLLTGAFGGPLLGAAVGAGISLTKNSEKAQDWIFGERDEEGNRQGGVVPKKFMDSISKYLPDFKTYGIAGAATGLLPLVPFGPIGGLLLGSGVAFAKRNQAVQDFLFGEEDGLFKPETKGKIKKMLPRLGLTVGASMMFGPFGFLGNALLGSGLGMLSTTDKFQQLIIGEKDKEGKYQGGLLPTLRDTIVDPLKGYMKGLGERVNEFLKEKIFKPVQSAFAPIKKDVELLLKGMFNGVGNFLNNMFEKSFGVPLNKLIEDKLIKPITGFLTKWVLKPTKWLGKKVLGAPSALIGAYGNSRRKVHIRTGNADYMTAQERLQFRKDKNIYTMGLFGEDKFYDVDEQLASMDDGSLGGIVEQLQNIKNDKKLNLANRKASAEDMAKDIIPHFKYTESKNIMRALRDGKFEEVIDYINKNPKFSQETKHKLRKSLYEKNKLFQEREKKRLSDIENKDTIFEQLRKQGIDVNDKNIDKYINMLSKEQQARGKNKPLEEEKTTEEKQLELEQKNHNEIVDLMKEAIDVLKSNNGEAEAAATTDGSGASKKILNAKSKKFKMRTDVVQKIDDDGTVRKYVYNEDGELVPDKSDPSTIKELKQEQKEENLKLSFYEKMGNMFKNGKDRLSDAKDTVKEKTGNFFSDLMGAASSVSKFIGIGSLIAGGIMAFMKTPDGENMLLSVAKKVGGWFTSIIGDGLKSILPDWAKKMLGIEGYGEGGVVDSAATAVGYDGASDVGNQIATTGVRQIVTGGSLKGGKLLGKVFKSGASGKGLLGKAVYFANPLNIAKETVKLGGRTAGRAVNGLSKLSNKLYDKVGITKFKDMILQKGKSKISSAASVVGDAVGNNDMIQSLIKSMKNHMENLLSNKVVANIIGSDKVKVLLEKFVPTVLKEVAERAGKAGSKVIAKVVGGLSTGGLLNIAWAVADFVSGFNDCKNILEIVQEPTFGMKVSTGVLKALNGLFIVTSFIPEKTWVKLVLDIILPLFGKEDTDLQKMREESKKIVEEYSATNGETSIEDYNKQNKKSLFKKIGEGTKSLFNSAKSFLGNVGSSISSGWKTFTSLFTGKGASEEIPEPDVSDMYTGIPSTVYTGKGPSTKYNPAKIYTGKGVSEEDIKYMELNAPIEKKITAADINKWVNPLAGQNSGMYNIGEAAIKAQNETGLDARYLVAHAAQETGWGKSQMARTKNNFFGIGAFNDSPDSALTFSKEAGFLEGAKWINHNFTKHGQNTLSSMINSDGHRYAVFDDGSPNTEWLNNIANIMYHSGSITSGSINKNATWDGQWADGNYSTSGSSAKDGTAASVSDSEATGASIFNAFTDLGTALTNDFNRIFGFDTGSSTSSSSSGSASEGDYTSRAGNYTAKKLNDFTYFSQSENPWANYIYKPSGGGMFSDPTIRERGCGTTSAAMVIRELTGNKDVDPASMADLSTEVGTSVEAGTAHSFFNIAGNKYGLNVSQTPITPSVLSTITKDNPMIINGTGGPGGRLAAPFYGGHFVVGVKGTKDSITINDPFSQSTSKTYKMSEIAPYMEQGWRFNKGGGKGPSLDKIEEKNRTYGKGPSMNLPSKVTNIIQNSPSTGNFEKILLSIVEILIKISDNSNYLSKIVDILSNTLGVKVSEQTKNSINTNASAAKQGIVNVIKQTVSESNPDNEYLLNLLDSLATQ